MIRVPRGYDWPVPLAAVELIADKEQGPRGGPALRAYQCPAGVWTIGFGRTRGVRQGMTCTADEAWQWLRDELAERADQVRSVCRVEPTPNQLGALVSLHYNIGHGAFAGTGPRPRACTVLQRHNEGDHDAAARAFGLWNKARVGGRLTVMRGLTLRRAAESALYLTPEPDDVPERMPQAVMPESSLTASPISRGGAVTVVSGMLVAAHEAQDQLGAIGGAVTSARGILDSIGIEPGLLLAVVLLVAGGAVLLWRYRQRREGWS